LQQVAGATLTAASGSLHACTRLRSLRPCAHAAGLVLAAELKRAVVLPDWLLNGMQKPDAKEVTSDDGGAIPFG
jgi:hypothetical protein